MLSFNDLSKIIDKYLVPQEIEVKNNAEISTPYELRQNMINLIPPEFWTTPKKVFEPCSGKGGFLLDIVERFMKGLNIKDEELKLKIILEECLYFNDINPTNIYICKLLLDPNNKYKLNYTNVNTLELNINTEWGIKGFDAIIGNPPYQMPILNGKSKPLWHSFVIMSVEILNEDAYLLYVHPSGWRDINGRYKCIQKLILDKNLIYLNMNDFKSGGKVFGAHTNFDYYLLQNNNNYTYTSIKDIDNKEYNINLKKWEFIPSGEFTTYGRLLAQDGYKKVDTLYSRSLYGTDKPHMSKKVEVLHSESLYEIRKPHISKTKTKKFIHPCCYTITIKNKMVCYYSSKREGHFDIPKVIWSNGTGTYPIIDEEGKYGLTNFSYAIVDKVENLEDIKTALENVKFINLMKYVKYTDHKYNYKIISLLKHDFYKEFI